MNDETHAKRVAQRTPHGVFVTPRMVALEIFAVLDPRKIDPTVGSVGVEFMMSERGYVREGVVVRIGARKFMCTVEEVP